MRKNLKLFGTGKKSSVQKTLIREFFDTYCLFDLLYRSQNFSIYSSHLVNLDLQYDFYEKLINLFNKTIIALDFSIRCEGRYVFSRTLSYRHDGIKTGSESKRKKWIKENNLGKYTKNNVPLNFLKEAFLQKWWYSFFGGEAWADGVDLLTEIKQKVVRPALLNDPEKNYITIMFYLDKIYDMYHNGGQILNKTEFSILESGPRDIDLKMNWTEEEQDFYKWSSLLDIRHDAKSPFDYYYLLSPKVQKQLLRASSMYNYRTGFKLKEV